MAATLDLCGTVIATYPGMDVGRDAVLEALHDAESDPRVILVEALGPAYPRVLATADEGGRCDASPKGDPAGWLVHVLDDTTVAIAERPGNRRVDGYRNVLLNPRFGLLFLIPGRGDTLRVNGRARLVREAPFLDDMVVKGHRPLLALVVDVEEVFFHCAKAFLRSGLWKPETWDPEAVARTMGTRHSRPARHRLDRANGDA